MKMPVQNSFFIVQSDDRRYKNPFVIMQKVCRRKAIQCLTRRYGAIFTAFPIPCPRGLGETVYRNVIENGHLCRTCPLYWIKDFRWWKSTLVPPRPHGFRTRLVLLFTPRRRVILFSGQDHINMACSISEKRCLKRCFLNGQLHFRNIRITGAAIHQLRNRMSL